MGQNNILKMRYLKKYVRFFEASAEVATAVKKPEINIPTAGEEEVVERLSRIYSELDEEGKKDIDSYFE